MYTKSSYTKLTEDRIDKNEKKSNWEVAIGLNEVDSLKPSKYLIELMQDPIEGKKSYKEVENALYSYYKELDKSINYFYSRKQDIKMLKKINRRL